MVLDHRLVQTAVLGHRRSSDPAYLPMERREALEFRRRHPYSTFWCGLLLGGCGGQLSPKVYRAKVSHFAHHASSNDCTRRHGGIESADHLYASKQVNSWLGGLGQSPREPEFTGDFASGGTCQRVTLPATNEHPTIFFEFSTDITEELDRLFTHMRGRSPSWLVRENLDFTQRLLRENGFVLRFRMRTRNLERVLEVGTTGFSGSTHWEAIEDCTFTTHGITTRRMTELAEARRQAPPQVPVVARSAPKEPKLKKPHPLITSLQFSLEQNDRANVRHLSHQLRLTMRASRNSGITGFQEKAEALLAWSSRLLAQDKRPPVTEQRPLYRPASLGKATTRPKSARTSLDHSKKQRSAQPPRQDRPRKQKADRRPPEKRALNTLITDAAKAYDTGDQNELRQIRAVLRKHRASASQGDKHRIDWVIESYPCTSREDSEPSAERKTPKRTSPPGRQPAPKPRDEESTMRAAIAKRREEIRNAPDTSRKPRPPAPSPSVEDLAEQINSRRTR
ncbi:hypothetical protein ACIQFP_24845 [Nocardiopsis alba]|uniref:hypothetical protein n=1 Tax=Nocardiopsis alba TaxID=53437 RepID=UPI003829C111